MATIKIKEQRPDGAGSFKAVLDSIRRAQTSSSDLRPIWPGIVNDVKQAMKYSFSDSNPNRWAKLTDKYRQWKIKNGYPATIGVMTGALKAASTDSADVTMQMRRMVYATNEGITNPRTGEKTGDYGQYFSGARPVYEYARKYINKTAARAAINAVKSGWGKNK